MEMGEATNCMIAIVVIGLVAITAVSKGLDGNLLGLAIIAIAGLGGFEVYQKAKNSVGPD